MDSENTRSPTATHGVVAGVVLDAVLGVVLDVDRFKTAATYNQNIITTLPNRLRDDATLRSVRTAKVSNKEGT